MTLNRHDRCDACYVSAAQVRIALKSERVIDLCLHHYGVNEKALMAAGAEVLVDQREGLRGSVAAAMAEGVS